MKKYEQVEHTADIGIRAYGADLKELFVNAACGMLDIVFDTDAIDENLDVPLEITGVDTEELLVNWLQELLYLFEVKHLALKRVAVEEIANGKLKATVFGERFDQKRHTAKTEIKAVSYHQLRIEKRGDILAVQIIFDI